ncbi:MAG: cell division protein FtsA [Bacteroidota bacterium]|nr:cell division protein FtsA [Bacteroidota bacterium]
MVNNYIAIIDIGTTKIVSMVGRKDPNGNMQILGFAERASEGVNRGLVLNIKEASEVIEEVVKDTIAQSGVEFKDVFVGIAGQHVKSRQITHSVLNPSEDLIEQELVDKLIYEVYNATVDPGEKILHVFPQEYEVNGNSVKNPVGILAKQLNGKFHISIIKDTSLNILKRSVNIAKMNITNTILEPVASAKAVLSEEEKDGGVALIDIGGGTTDLIIFKNNIVRYTAVIPFGGNSITNDLQEGCKIVYSKAEEIKKQYGSAIPDLVNKKESVNIPGIRGRESKDISFYTIAEIIKARVTEIIDTVYHEIKKSEYLNKLSAGLTVTGGGALLKHLKEFIEFRTGLETRIAYPEDFIYSNSERILDPKYATAIGLLKKAYEYKENEGIKYFNKAKLKEEEEKKEAEEKNIENETNEDIVEEKTKENNRNIFKEAIEKLRDLLVVDDDEVIDDEN